MARVEPRQAILRADGRRQASGRISDDRRTPLPGRPIDAQVYDLGRRPATESRGLRARQIREGASDIQQMAVADVRSAQTARLIP